MRLVEQTREIRWIQPSAIEIEEVPLPVPPEDEFAEPIPDVRGSAARGRVLHKLMEEILSGELHGEQEHLQDRASQLLHQLGQDDHPDPLLGPSSAEIASTVTRTLALPPVARYRQNMQPEFGIFQLITEGSEINSATSGVIDAVGFDCNGNPEVVFDWKTDVSPTSQVREHHAEQVRRYLQVVGVSRGFVVYVTSGVLHEVAPKRNDALFS